jgi:hypothetical protein
VFIFLQVNKVMVSLHNFLLEVTPLCSKKNLASTGKQ